MKDVFVSYSQPDRQLAFQIVSHLEMLGVSVWIAPRDVAPSSDWAAEIIEAIARSKVMVLVFSSASNDSPQVRREVERAVYRQVAILPVRIEEVMPTRSMEYFLSAQHWFDAFPPPLCGHFARLGQQVQALLRGHRGQITPTNRPSMTAEEAPRLPGFPAEVLAPLQIRLADYVGPLASYLVARAAVSAQDLPALFTTLAAEIDAPAARQAFLDYCHANSSRS